MRMKKHIAIGFYRTIGIGFALAIGAIVLIIIALITGASLEFMGISINQ